MSETETRIPLTNEPPKPVEKKPIMEPSVPLPPKQEIPVAQPKTPQPVQEKHVEEKKKQA